MKRILIIDNATGLTGSLKVMLYVAQSLSHAFAFHFACPPGNPALTSAVNRENIYLFPVRYLEIAKSWRTVFYLPVLLFNTIKLYKYCKSRNIDIIHVNDLYNMTGLLLKLLNPKFRLIYHVRLLPGSYAGRLYRVWLWLIARKANKVVGVSQVVCNEVAKQVNTQKLLLLYDYLPLPEVAEAAHNRKTDAVHFLYLANFTPGKGHDLALAAFRRALAAHPNLKLTFAGSDLGRLKNKAYREQLQKSAADLVQAGYVQFLPPAENVAQLYATHDVVLNFSKSESFSMTCYEAAFYGLPVIATRCGGPEEIVVHEQTGLLVRQGDVQEMATCMLELAGNPEKRKALGRNARLLTLQRQASHHALEQYHNLYRQV
jgi:glycosyltransferase involved in cell wall biosynthesis